MTGFTCRKSRNRPRAEEFDDALRDLEDSNAVTVLEGTNQFRTAYKFYEAVLPPRHAVPPDVYVIVKKVMTDIGSKWIGHWRNTCVRHHLWFKLGSRKNLT